MENATLDIEGVTLRYNSKKLDFEKPVSCWYWVVAYCRKNKYRIKTNQPLSRDIYDQLRAIISPKAVSSRDLYTAIGFHVSSIKYLNRLQAGRERFNLWGKPEGVVSEKEAQHARQKMAELHASYLRAKRKSKKQGIIVNPNKGRTRHKSSGNKTLTLNKSK
jgi:sRNA-binding protein